MNRAVVVAALLTSGCGRIAFDPLGDGGTTDDSSGPPADAPANAFLRCQAQADLLTWTMNGPAAPIRTLEMRVRFPQVRIDKPYPTNTLMGALNPGMGQSYQLGVREAFTPPEYGTTTTAFSNSYGAPAMHAISTTWQHLAFVFTDTPTVRSRLYVDGVESNNAAGPNPSIPDFSDGRICDGVAAEIDWFRASSVERYTAPFTPPTLVPVYDFDAVVLLSMDLGMAIDEAHRAHTSTMNVDFVLVTP